MRCPAAAAGPGGTQRVETLAPRRHETPRRPSPSQGGGDGHAIARTPPHVTASHAPLPPIGGVVIKGWPEQVLRHYSPSSVRFVRPAARSLFRRHTSRFEGVSERRRLRGGKTVRGVDELLRIYSPRLSGRGKTKKEAKTTGESRGGVRVFVLVALLAFGRSVPRSIHSVVW